MTFIFKIPTNFDELKNVSTKQKAVLLGIILYVIYVIYLMFFKKNKDNFTDADVIDLSKLYQSRYHDCEGVF